MRLKLDENLGKRGQEILIQAGHDVLTVEAESLQEAPDTTLIEKCLDEARALVSLDLDFANPLHFKPSKYSGIAVRRLPRRPNRKDLVKAVRTLAAGLEKEELNGRLWIVEAERIRIFQEEQI